MRQWIAQRLDVVVILEHHLAASREIDALAAFIDEYAVASQHPGFAHRAERAKLSAQARAQQSRPSGGVLVLLHKGRLASGELRELAGSPASPPSCLRGRALCVALAWAGHKRINLVGAYMPNAYADQQRALKALHSLPWYGNPSTQAHTIIAGDFNFVEDAGLDRLRIDPGAGEGTDRGNRETTREFRERFPELVDVFRALHPTRRSFTHQGGWGAARLDRVYAGPELAPYFHQCAVGHSACSDHRLVVASLAARGPRGAAELGPGLRKVRARSLSNANYRILLNDWLAAELPQHPQEPAALLAWWAAFKPRLRAQVAQLDAAARAEAQARVAETGTRAAATKALLDAHDALDLVAQIAGAAAPAEAAAQLAAGLDAVAAARAVYTATVKADADPVTVAARMDWLHQGERPNPAITASLRPPAASRFVAALQAPAGHMVGPGRAQAQLVAEHWAHVSSEPPTHSGAQAEVLAALDAHMAAEPTRRLAPEAAATLGAACISADEVHAALKRTPSGRSPGLDGLPGEVYRHCAGALAPVLAKVFSAMHATGAVPRGLLDGAITVLPKPGDSWRLSSYRPITLLNSDYRILARVLAARLLACLAAIISPSQSAFVKGRRIGDPIVLLQLVPHLLKQRGQRAVIACLDFAKAFDTISRGFLLQVMERMGVGDGFLAWARLLLTNTRACAVVNGHVSRMVPFKAGVRQGCPLSPLLYLFIGEALLAFLRARGFGISVAGLHLVLSQFADDTQVFIDGIGRVPAFVGAMGTFGDASGQHLNVDKSRVLQVGAGPHDVPLPAAADAAPRVAGIPVVHSCTILGVGVADAGADACAAERASAEQRLEGVVRCLGKIARWRNLLSTFGRAFAASGYALPQALYHMEYAGLPPARALKTLESQLAAAVERSIAPGSGERGFAGVKAALLPGHPAEGGLGLLPLREHVRARWAAHACRLLAALADEAAPCAPGWRAAASVLEFNGSAGLGAPGHPLALLGSGAAAVGAVALAPQPLPPPPLYPAPPPAQDPGPWVWAESLVNLNLQGSPMGGPLVAAAVRELQAPVGVLSRLDRRVRRVGDVVHLHRLLLAATLSGVDAVRWRAIQRQWFAHPSDYSRRYQDPARLRRHLARVLRSLPEGWLAAARAVDAAHVCHNPSYAGPAPAPPPPPPLPPAPPPAHARCGAAPLPALPPPLARMAEGLAALPGLSLARADRSEPEPGAWCAALPLWACPLLPRPPAPDAGGAPPAAGAPPSLDAAFWDLWEAGHAATGGPPTIGTLGQALCALARARAARATSAAAYEAEVWVPLLHAHPRMRDPAHFCTRIEALLGALPEAWVGAARAALGLGAGAAGAPPPDAEGAATNTAAVIAAWLPHISWRLPEDGCSPALEVHAAQFTVRLGTRAQLGAVNAERARKHQAFIDLALRPEPGRAPPPPAAHADLAACFRGLFKTRWDNSSLEVFWRLALNGLPNAARMPGSDPVACVCGEAAPDREHHYWSCPATHMLLGILGRELRRSVAAGGGNPDTVTLRRDHLWLMRKPPGWLEGLPVGLWQVVCLAALCAMDSARKLAFKIVAKLPAPAPTPGAMLRVRASAAANFVALLQDFAVYAEPPKAWIERVGAAGERAPFFAMRSADSLAARPLHPTT